MNDAVRGVLFSNILFRYSPEKISVRFSLQVQAKVGRPRKNPRCDSKVSRRTRLDAVSQPKKSGLFDRYRCGRIARAFSMEDRKAKHRARKEISERACNRDC